MPEFGPVLLLGALVGLSLWVVMAAESHSTCKKEAFDRGFMVQCAGKTGYYWECE